MGMKARAIAWMWPEDELARAREAAVGLDEHAHVARRRAALALEAAERLRVASPLSNGDPSPLSLLLFVEAARFALRAAARDPGESVETLVEQLGDEPIADVPQARVRALLLAPSIPELLDLPEDARTRMLGEARAVAHALVAAVVRRADEPAWLVARGWLRAAAVALVLTLLALLVHARMAPRDLASGKPYEASSAWGDFGARGVVTAPGMKPFFHTDEQDDPWVVVDLGQDARIGAFEIHNRVDCCAERAVPLVLELSRDRARWDVVARRDTPFSIWSGSVTPQTARWVRVRAPRRVMLHLSGIRVFAR